MIDIIIGIAQGVIQSVIVDLINGRRAARKNEIETAVAAVARERQVLSTEQLDEVVSRTMTEILEIIKRDPDLTVGPFGTVRLAHQVEKKNTPELRDEILTDRLHRLYDIVDRRRASLGLPLQSTIQAEKFGEPATTTDADPVIKYEQVSDESPPKDWRSELDAMKDRVHKRRTGQTRSDDQ